MNDKYDDASLDSRRTVPGSVLMKFESIAERSPWQTEGILRVMQKQEDL
jgi:hypothetical protein